MSVALMTAIFGGIDQRKFVPAQNIIFNKYFYDDSSGDLSRSKLNDRTKALFFKTQGHWLCEEEIIVWVDGKIQIQCFDFLTQCIDALGNGDLAILKHPQRKCIYEEVDFIEEKISKGDSYLTTRYANRPIREQVEHYRQNGYPSNNGLNDCCIICRRNNPHTNHLFNLWWEACKREHFDQTAIQYLAWKNNIEIKSIVFRPGSFKHFKHKILK